MNRPGWNDITAVENGNVYILSIDVFGGAKYFIGLDYLAKIIQTDLVSDLDPKTVHQEYITRFQELDYNLENHGVFVYPRP